MRSCLALTVAALLAALPGPAAHARTPTGPLPARPLIVGGSDVVDAAYPFVVSVQRLDLGASPLQRHLCGGSLIADAWVLTAAHCVRNVPGAYGVRVGQTRLDDGSGRTVAVSEVHIHPDHDVSGTADVALLRLAEPVTDIAPARLLHREGASHEQPGRLLTVAGWGALREGGHGPITLQQVEVPFIAAAECQRQYAGRFTVDAEREMCAGLAGKDSCQGDSGGPLFVQAPDRGWFQLGVVSWGAGCAREGSPGVYARLAGAAIDDFIAAVMARD